MGTGEALNTSDSFNQNGSSVDRVYTWEAEGTGEPSSDILIISPLLGSRATAWLAKASRFLEGRAQSMTADPGGQHSLTHSKVYIGLEFHVAGKMREESGACR